MIVGRIRKLSDALINKIAAGEVVERPASVVKELVENALDADARAIAVDLRDGGATLVRVADDGFGMSADDLALALERHATSKLARDEDLDAISTLGFRGEALPAICAVSRFVVTSRARGAGDGTRVAGEGGVITQRLGVASDGGTTVEVRDLFFNTPARLKFLKAGPTETAASLRVLTQLAIAQPEVQFRATSNGRPALTAPRAADLRERLGALWGYDVAGRLLSVQRDEHGVTVHGWASPPDLTRGGRDEIVLTVNGRPVRDPQLFQCVLAAYRPLLPRDRFPYLALSIALPAADVDVNVHPSKAWVRFRHPRLVQEMIVAAVGDALRRDSVMPVLRAPLPGPAGMTTPVYDDSVREQPALFAEAATPYGPRASGVCWARCRTRSSFLRRTPRCSFWISTWPTSACSSSGCRMSSRWGRLRRSRCCSPSRSSCRPPRTRCSSAGARRSSAWASRWRDSAAPPCSCAPYRFSSRATSPGA